MQFATAITVFLYIISNPHQLEDNIGHDKFGSNMPLV